MATYTIKPLVTATAINTGGRNGHSETTDHSVSVDLSVPKEMGGPGRPGTTTPRGGWLRRDSVSPSISGTSAG
jgi:osmotically inducible protein OsmC